MKAIKKIIKWTLIAVLTFLVYVVGCLIHGTITDFQPEEVINLEIIGEQQEEIIKTKTLSFLNWNVGYGGLGGKSNFFYDNGNPFFFSGDRMVRSPEDYVKDNIEGIGNFIENNKADFVLLQEVDQNSKRSYFINQQEEYQKRLTGYSNSFAVNYKVARVVIPVMKPWDVMGKMQSGLSSYSRFRAESSTRYQFPGSYGWPDYIFHLDRCMLVQRYKTIHPENKELIIINTHKSAYDGGKLKQKEMEYFRTFVLGEYKKGNYIVVGGDWNQTPPGVPFDKPGKAIGVATDSSYHPQNIKKDFMPSGWQWVFDDKTPTNRAMKDVLEYGKTAVTLVDYYLVSPNIKVLKAEGKNLKFEHSDHNPVLMQVELQDFPPIASDSTEH